MIALITLVVIALVYISGAIVVRVIGGPECGRLFILLSWFGVLYAKAFPRM